METRKNSDGNDIKIVRENDVIVQKSLLVSHGMNHDTCDRIEDWDYIIIFEVWRR